MDEKFVATDGSFGDSGHDEDREIKSHEDCLKIGNGDSSHKQYSDLQGKESPAPEPALSQDKAIDGVAGISESFDDDYDCDDDDFDDCDAADVPPEMEDFLDDFEDDESIVSVSTR